MSGLYDDNLGLVAPEDFVPHSVRALLRMYGVSTDAPRDRQVETIRNWLKTHKPSPAMEYSILAEGFADVLTEPAGTLG
jgi:hypothetical protein